jgi:hypothetical protein
MGKFISNLFLGALAIGLSIFTGSRTLDLLAWALPAGQTIYQWLGLAAFEGGMYFWSFYFVSGAKGTPQRSISLIMAIFSVVAVCVATVADMTLDAGQSGKIAPLSSSMQQTMIVFVGITVALNVAAFLSTKLMSIEKLREIAEGQAEDRIYGEGLRAIEAIAPQIAADAAPYLAAEWSNRTWQKIVPGVQRNTQYLGPVAPVPALPAGPESVPLYRDDQRSRRTAPSAGLPPASDEESEPLSYCDHCKQYKQHGRTHQLNDGNRMWYCLDCSPVGKGIKDKTKRPGSGLVARAKGFLGNVLGGGPGSMQAPATLEQTDYIPTLEPAAKPVDAYEAYIQTHRPTRLPRNSHSSVAASRRARRSARFRGAATPGNYQATETAKQERKDSSAAPAPDEHRTCSECGGVLDLHNAKQLTCSPACRSKRSRRLAADRKARKA